MQLEPQYFIKKQQKFSDYAKQPQGLCSVHFSAGS